METYFFFGKSLVHHVFQVLDLPLKHVHLRSPSHFRRRSRYSSPSMVAVSTSLLTCSDFTDTVDALLDGLETSPRPFEASAKATAQPRSSHLPKPGNTFLFCFWFTPTPNISICERQHPGAAADGGGTGSPAGESHMATKPSNEHHDDPTSVWGH
eukprot:3536505-Rhodomonas_salina.2